jgi:DNA-binding winged helix-turn-helix (wHTH) protein/tetratricopeptide (TPR) repeat protein
MHPANAGSAPPVARFAAFDLNPRAHELTKNGRRIRLPGLPFEVLVVLVERAGEVVTREELQRRLWPDGTFVDFDNNLNAAVARLRQTLGDSAERPRFIETIPRLGYRFIATVDRTGAGETGVEALATAESHASDTHVSNVETPSPTLSVDVAFARPVSSSEGRPSRRRFWTASLAVVVVTAVAATAAWSWWQGRPAQLSRAAQGRGNEFTRRGELKAAAQEFQLAVQLDPRNANAYAELAHALNRLSFRNSVATPVGESPSVIAAARSVELDPNCGGCHGSYAFFLFYHDWHWTRAEEHFNRALQLTPERYSIRPAYAMLLAATGRLREALEQIDLALKAQPLEVGWHTIRAAILYLDRRYEESISASGRAMAITQDERGPWEWRSKALFQLGRGEEAVKALAQVAFAEYSLQLDAAVREGGRDAGLRALLDLTGDWRSEREQAWRRGPWRALLDDTDGALSELETAYELRNVNLVYIGTDPVFDKIRDHPRFQKILRGMGLRVGITR